MTEIDMPARVVDGGDYETVLYPADEIWLRVTDAGNVQVTEYVSDDRDGPPPHTHEWDEIEYVIEGEVEFRIDDGPWVKGGPGTTQLLPAGAAHTVRVPSGTARILMITIGAPYDGFARELSAYYAGARPPALDGIVAVAARHGVRLAS